MKETSFKATQPDHEFRTKPLERPEYFNFAYDIFDEIANVINAIDNL